MCASLAPKQLEEFYSYSVLKDFIRHGSVPENKNTPVPKTLTLHNEPKTQNVDLLEEKKV
jgi:hypothetical protein